MSERDDKTMSGRVLRCDEWEDMIADALDGSLSPVDAAAFTRHHGECALCAQMFKETQQGRAWMEYLAVEPEVPSDLLRKILARTSEPPAMGIAMPALAVPARPARYRVTLPHLRQVARHVLEPRLMMTIAMAFFSIALTLNLTGINLGQIRPADLQPSRLRATVTRQYYAANEQVTKYYENLRLVYEMEARVRELRRSTEAEPASAPSSRPSPNQNPRQPMRDGSGPSSTVPRGQQEPEHFYRPQAEPLPASFDRNRSNEKVKREVFRALRSMTEDQAERSLV
jgi:Putative zinc-finger